MKHNLHIKTPRQVRAVEALLAHPEGIPCKELGDLIGALNPHQTVMELRRQGFGGVIITKRFEVEDRDGKRCRPGLYLIPDKHCERVKKALKESATGSAATEPAANDIAVKDDHNIRGLQCQH